MSYQFYDADGYISDFASGGGLAQLNAFAEDCDHDGLRAFLKDGFATPDELDDLPKSDDEAVNAILKNLAKAAKGADEIIIISNGLTSDDDVIKLEKLAKGKKKVPRIDRERPEILKARAKLHAIFTEVFKAGKKAVRGLSMEKMEKQDAATKKRIQAILDELDLTGWTVLIGESEEVIAGVTASGVYQALLQIGLNDEHLTDTMSNQAREYAAERGAELVGKKIVDGEIVENPNPVWAIDQATREMLRGDVTQAVEEGWSTKKLQDKLVENYAFSDERAETISRTEIAFADSRGNFIAYKESGLVSGKEWLLGSEHDEPDECDENEAKGVIGLDEEFPSGDMEAPAHPRCLLPGTVVSAGGVSKTFKRWFEGEIVILSVSGMDDLSATPNHPILTRRGWIAAGKLTELDDLVYCTDPGAFVRLMYPDDNHMKTRIEDIASTLLMTGSMASSSVPTSAVDFHGDGMVDGKVDIVGAASELRNNAKAGSGKHPEQLKLVGTNGGRSILDSNSAIAEFFKSLLFPPDCIVSGISASSAGRSTGAGSFNGMGIGPVSNHQTEPFENIPQGSAMTAKAFGNIDTGLTGNVGSVKSVNIGILESSPLKLDITERTDIESGIEKRPLDDFNRDAFPLGDRFHSLAGLVGFVHLSKIRKEDFSGHVYNLQTRDGYYIAHSRNGINLFVHNCVCDWLPVLAEAGA